MNRITIKIDVNKIDKNRISTRTYTNKEGAEVTVKELSLDVVPLKEAKLIKSGETWDMVKSCFVTHSATKEERQAKTKLTAIGDGVEFRDKAGASKDLGSVPYPTEEIKPEDIPF